MKYKKNPFLLLYSDSVFKISQKGYLFKSRRDEVSDSSCIALSELRCRPFMKQCSLYCFYFSDVEQLVSTMKAFATIFAFLAVANAFAPMPAPSRANTQLSESLFDKVSANIVEAYVALSDQRCITFHWAIFYEFHILATRVQLSFLYSCLLPLSLSLYSVLF